MVELKTKENNASVKSFIGSVKDKEKRDDSFELLKIFQKITGKKPKMWGESIIGFGKIHYKYASGREGDWMATGFSPRKQNISLYVLSGFKERDELLKKLGKHKTGRACLYIKNLKEINLSVLKKIIEKSYKDTIRKQKLC